MKKKRFLIIILIILLLVVWWYYIWSKFFCVSEVRRCIMYDLTDIDNEEDLEFYKSLNDKCAGKENICSFKSLIKIFKFEWKDSEIISNDDVNESIWIIRNEENWTIILDHWEESITLMDKNLWAELPWTGSESYGYYFQWWNNHGFQLNSEIKTWKDLVTRDVALQYWPNNPYDSDVQFVVMDNGEEVNRNLNLGNYFLAAVNDNLRWWSGDSEIVNRMGEYVIDQFRWDTSNPRAERKWPCPEWYHVPSFGESHKLFKIWINIKYPDDIKKKEHVRWMSIWGGKIWAEFSNDLLLPMAWWIRFDGNGTLHDQWQIWYYWMSSHGRFLNFWNDAIVEYAESNRAATFSVRCFKD